MKRGSESEDMKPAKRTFQPAETWVLPARRSAIADHPDTDDVAKKRAVSASATTTSTAPAIVTTSASALTTASVTATAPVKTFLDEDFVELAPATFDELVDAAPATSIDAAPVAAPASHADPDRAVIDHPSRGRTIVQAGFGLCVSIVMAACGGRDHRPSHVGPPLGDTHVSQAPTDPTVPPPDAADYEQPSPGYSIQAPIGNAPIQPSNRQPQTPTQAPTSDQQQPGVFSPPPPSENQPGASQSQIPQPAPPSTTPLPQDRPQQ